MFFLKVNFAWQNMDIVSWLNFYRQVALNGLFLRVFVSARLVIAVCYVCYVDRLIFYQENYLQTMFCRLTFVANGTCFRIVK